MGNIINSKKAGAAVLFGGLLLWATLCIANDREWGYDPPKVLPSNWHTLQTDACPTPGPTTAQSPIDFSQSKNTPKDMRVKRKNLRDIVYDYHGEPLNIINRGFDVQVRYDPNSQTPSTIQLTKKGPLYKVLQYHFHAPSEHTVELGGLFDMEIHIVHQNLEDPSKLAVVGVVKEGQENAALKPIFDNMGSVENEGDTFMDDNVLVNLDDVLPNDRRYFAYDGSLTTPPCSEIVEWRVLREPIEMSREQIDAFVAVLHNSCCSRNNRPTQPINGRRIKLDKK